MYQGGVSVPAKLASDLSGDKTSELTIWDENTKYGDYNTISNGKPITLGANGEVVIRVSLICVTDAGYQGEYKFAFAGMDNGKGFPTNGTISGPSGNGLFAPANDGKINGKLIFTRWYEIDLSKRTTTKLFGAETGSGTINNNKIGEHASTPYVYTNANGGNAIDGYKIINVNQLKAIEDFWEANENSCVGITKPSAFELFTEDGDIYPIWIDEASVEYTDNYKNNYGRTKFILTASQYNIVGLTIEGKTGDPMGNVVEWEPLCKGNTIMEDTKYVWGTNMMPERTGGFDGILEGNNALICGIATKASNHTYFGLFSAVSGGEVRNLTIDNAFISTDDAQNVGLLAGLITYSTINNIIFEQKTSYAITSRGGYDGTVSNGTRVYLNAPQADNVGLLAGIINNSKVTDISITVAKGANYSIEVNGAVNSGLLAGTAEGSETEISAISVNGNNSWVIISGYQGRSTNAGGIIGLMSSSASMMGVMINSDVNMMIGHYSSTTNAGGIVGKIEGEKTSLSYVTIDGYRGGNADNFSFYEDYGEIYGKGIFILARGGSGYGTNIASSETIGKAGGLVGVNAGIINNYDGNIYYNVKGVFKMHGGYIGGIAGVNTGRITGFDLKAGYNSSSYYSGIMVMAWFDSSSVSYGVGGIAGANISKSQANQTVKETGTDEYTLEKELSGVIDDCSITGIADVKNSGDTTWQVGHIYAFVRYNSNDTSHYIIQTGGTQSSLGYIYSHNIMMGGIVGYNAGSVFNSFVKQTKLTFNVQNDASLKATKIDPLDGGNYSWGIEAGLIVGYHDPAYTPTYGWLYVTDVLYADNISYARETMQQTLALDMITGRIQSCYAVNSVITVVGRVFMDNTGSSAMGNSGSLKESLKCAVSMGGISGGASAKANAEFSITTCYSSGNNFIYKVQPYGNANYGWHRYVDESGYNSYYCNCINPFHQVEITFATICAGIKHNTDANKAFYNKVSSGTAKYTTSDDNYSSSNSKKYYHPDDGQSSYGAVIRFEQNSFWHLRGGYPPTDATRYTRYNSSNGTYGVDSIRPGESGSSGGAIVYHSINSSTSGINLKGTGEETVDESYNSYGINYGIMKGKLIKTDVNTGMLIYFESTSLTTIRKGEAVSGAYDKDAVLYEFMLNGEPWTLYNASLAAPGGLETNPSTAIFCVRGQ